MLFCSRERSALRFLASLAAMKLLLGLLGAGPPLEGFLAILAAPQGQSTVFSQLIIKIMAIACIRDM